MKGMLLRSNQAKKTPLTCSESSNQKKHRNTVTPSRKTPISHPPHPQRTFRKFARKNHSSLQRRVSRKLRSKKRVAHSQLRLHFPGDTELHRRFWQRRYYDSNIYTRPKLREKLDYIHANPVRERLVRHPNPWPWSSWAAHVGKPAMLQIDFQN
jgi:hypothetical protein